MPMAPNKAGRSSLTRFAWLSIAAAVLTIGLKAAAYLLTGSVGLLSDALESLVNLLMALAMLTIAAQPTDEEHAFGHSKAEYFSSGVEGTLILGAAVGIVVAAVPRLIAPKPLEQIGVGIGVSLAASVINFIVARILLQAARRNNSITLEANSRHLMTDVWTSGGVLDIRWGNGGRWGSNSDRVGAIGSNRCNRCGRKYCLVWVPYCARVSHGAHGYCAIL